ncbi:MAG: PspC domain-containing protein [Flavobacteriaceae bacterium]
MNKTININLGGIFFHIDEDAYKILKKYLEAIRKSLSDDPKGKDEILIDIESRIGELLDEKVKDVRQVVNEQDIEDIIQVMGKPEEYIGDEEFFDDASHHSGSNSKKSKKLYRDMNDKFLGGVSSGLAHYFGLDVTWVRIGWLLLLLGGVSVILYPILWIILPEANSTSERLEMEGEAVNITNIERKIKEEFNKASTTVKDGIDDVSSHLKNGNYQGKVRNGLQEIISLFSRVFKSIFNLGGKFIGILLVVISIASLIAMLIGGFFMGSFEILGMSDEFTNLPPFFYNSQIPIWLLTTFGFILFIIPFVLLFILGLRIISKKEYAFSKTTYLSLIGVWLISAFGLAFAGIEYKAMDANHFTKMERITINNDKTSDTLKIKMIANDNFELRRYYDDKIITINNTEFFYGTNVKLNIKESNSNETYLKINKEAFGISKLIAKEHANEMDYKFDTIANTLVMDAFFLSGRNNTALRNSRHKNSRQSIRMSLYIPVGQTIYLDKSTKIYLSNVDNVQDIYDKKMIKHYYQMTDDGLNCLDCENDK